MSKPLSKYSRVDSKSPWNLRRGIRGACPSDSPHCKCGSGGSSEGEGDRGSGGGDCGGARTVGRNESAARIFVLATSLWPHVLHTCTSRPRSLGIGGFLVLARGVNSSYEKKANRMDARLSSKEGRVGKGHHTHAPGASRKRNGDKLV